MNWNNSKQVLCFITVLLIGFCSTPTLLAHNIHSSLTNIEWNSDDSSLEVILSLHGHELEARLSYDAGKKLSFLNTTDHEQLEPSLRAYLKSNLEVFSESGKVPLDYIGIEVQGQTVFVYLEKSLPVPPRTLSVSNTLLLDVFHDQVNTVIVRMETDRQSGDTYRDNESVTFHFAVP